MATRAKTKAKASDPYQDFAIAIELVGKGQYKKAKSTLEKLRKSAAEDSRLTARIDCYVKICDRRLFPKAGPPADGEAAYDHGVFAHNRGDYEAARSHYNIAIKMVDEKDTAPILVALAATEAEAGEKTAPLTYLKKALQIDENVRFLALGDPDFERLRQTDAFRRLVAPPRMTLGS